VSKRTRNRQLAKQAQARQAEKHRRQRNRQIGTIAVALVVALIGGFVLYGAFAGDEPATTGPSGPTPASSGPTGPTATGPTGPTGEPGSVTGTVDPQPGPEEVACGGSTPKGALKPKPQFNAPAEVLKKNHTYTATFQTSCGDIVVELLADTAPATVNSFVFLAEQGFFDATRIHRIDSSIAVLQGGDPTGTGTGGPGYSIPDEYTGKDTYGPGTLAMANTGSPNSGGSQFFIITGDNGHGLDASPTYTVFGKVIEGLDVAQTIQGLDIQDPNGGIDGQQPAQAVYIEKVTITSEPS
jgi:cyclophilin family peptidyl-prolyl cis-trans isomerase